MRITSERDPLIESNAQPQGQLEFDQITVVIFLADIQPKKRAAGSYEQVHLGPSLLPLFCSSVVALYPNTNFVMLTSPGTQLPPLPVPISVFSHPVSDGPVLYYRLSAYINFLEGAADDQLFAFLESDMLLLRRLRLPRMPDWDLALTYKVGGALINSGMILVRGDHRAGAIAFLREAQRLYEERYWDHPFWGSDQDALRDAVGLTETPTAQRVQRIKSANVLLLSRDEFTRFVDPTSDALLRRPPTYILHFSGWCKEMMRPYYWLHLGRGAPLGWALSRLITVPLVGSSLSGLLQSRLFGPHSSRLIQFPERVRRRLRRVWGKRLTSTPSK